MFSSKKLQFVLRNIKKKHDFKLKLNIWYCSGIVFVIIIYGIMNHFFIYISILTMIYLIIHNRIN